MLLIGLLPFGSINLLFCTTKDHLPQWAGPFHISHLSRKCPKDLSTGQSDGGKAYLTFFFLDDSQLYHITKA